MGTATTKVRERVDVESKTGAALEQLLEPAVVAQALGLVQQPGRLAPHGTAVAVEHGDAHAEQHRAVVGGVEEHLLGSRRTVEQIHLRTLRQAFEIALEQPQVETERLGVHLGLARHPQVELLADRRDVGAIAQYGPDERDHPGDNEAGHDRARELPGAGDHAHRGGRAGGGGDGGHRSALLRWASVATGGHAFKCGDASCGIPSGFVAN